MNSREADTTPSAPESQLDAAIREWIVPALARKFLQLQLGPSKATSGVGAAAEDLEQNYSSEQTDFALLGEGQSTKEQS